MSNHTAALETITTLCEELGTELDTALEQANYAASEAARAYDRATEAASEASEANSSASLAIEAIQTLSGVRDNLVHACEALSAELSGDIPPVTATGLQADINRNKKKVMELVRKGATHKQIAGSLKISSILIDQIVRQAA